MLFMLCSKLRFDESYYAYCIMMNWWGAPVFLWLQSDAFLFTFPMFFSFVVTNYLTEAAGGNGQKGDLWGEGGGHVIWCRPTHRKLPLVASLHLDTLPILPSLTSSSSSNPWAHLLHCLSSCANFSVRFTERNTLGFFHQNKAFNFQSIVQHGVGPALQAQHLQQPLVAGHLHLRGEHLWSCGLGWGASSSCLPQHSNRSGLIKLVFVIVKFGFDFHDWMGLCISREPVKNYFVDFFC